MTWELDHVFLATSDADSAEQVLADFGLAFSERRVHSGQGTANVCAVFENAFFEILRPFDVRELGSASVKPLGLEERIHWHDTGACPFGVCFRPSAADGEPEPWSFETWPYEPPYLPRGTSVPIVTPPRCLADPLVFVTRRSRPAERESPGTSLHRGARRTLTGVKIYRPSPRLTVSAGVRWFSENGHLAIEEGPAHVLELEWDHGSDRMTHVFPSALPIVLRW